MTIKNAAIIAAVKIVKYFPAKIPIIKQTRKIRKIFDFEKFIVLYRILPLK